MLQRKRSNMIYSLLLLTSFRSVISVRRYALRGKAFTLFPNADVENNDKEVTLYVNESTLIATWTWKNGPIELVNMNPDYTGRIDMDRNKNIWIFEVDINDNGNYCIKCRNTDKVIGVELIILVRRYAFRGQAFTLFSNADVEKNDKEESLYINGSTLIAKWTWKNGPIELLYMNPDYTGRIDMDRSKNIWIWKVDVNDTAKYCIKCSETDKGIEVELNVLEKWTEEEIKNWLDSHPMFIEKYIGNLTDEVRKEITKWLKDYPGFTEKFIGSLYIMMTILVFVIFSLVETKHAAKVYKMLKSSWAWYRKYETNYQWSIEVKSSVEETMHESSQWQLEKNKWQKQRGGKDKLDVDEDSDGGSVDFFKNSLLEEFDQKA